MFSVVTLFLWLGGESGFCFDFIKLVRSIYETASATILIHLIVTGGVVTIAQKVFSNLNRSVQKLPELLVFSFSLAYLAIPSFQKGKRVFVICLSLLTSFALAAQVTPN